MRKKSFEGWIVKRHKLLFSRSPLWHNDSMILTIYRGNPNRHNYTQTNNWKKIRITITEFPTTRKERKG